MDNWDTNAVHDITLKLYGASKIDMVAATLEQKK